MRIKKKECRILSEQIFQWWGNVAESISTQTEGDATTTGLTCITNTTNDKNCETKEESEDYIGHIM